MGPQRFSPSEIAEILRSRRQHRRGPPEAIFADEVEVRHMTGTCAPTRLSGGQLAASLDAEQEAFRAAMADFQMIDQRYVVGSDSIAQTMALSGTLPDGERLFVPICAVYRLEDGRIAAIDAYMDSVLEAKYVALVRAHAPAAR